ncbi:MAG: TIGR04211 family SH3 domain-containing protein [Alishewanella agri]|nr:TIGR04211 family SH3 domain-containing protein [Alishewanella agri]
MFSIFRSCCRRLFLLSLLLCWLPAQAQTEQQPAFISDNLVVYLHSGPGNQYRIVGTLTAGSEVIKLAEQDGYVQIQIDETRSGWIPKENLSFTPGIRSQLTDLQSRFEQQSVRLTELEQLSSEGQQALQRLTLERDQAQAELEQLKRSNERFSKELDAQQASFWQQPMVLGGAILLFGLLFGLILPKLIPQRRNSERWM